MPFSPEHALRRSAKSILLFWVPLAATWLMMASEGPFLAAIIARLADPKFNLAAHGVAFAFAILVEAPVIMMMSASTALVEDATSFRRLRNFTYVLSLGVTAVMLVVLIPPVFFGLMEGAIGLPRDVARLTYVALWILLPWPGAIGYRRFYQGLLIRDGRTRLVAYGTVVRLLGMAGTALFLYLAVSPPGAYVGAAALAVGVSLEALVSRWMARHTVRALVAEVRGEHRAVSPLSYRRIVRFYYPLALTSVIGLAVQPMLTFFMGRAPAPVESLAVYPVVFALSFIFRALGLSYQEVAIALMGRQYEHVRELWHFALGLAVATSAGLALIAFTPLARVWFETVSGLSPELSKFALVPTMVLVPLPALSVILSLQRAILVNARATQPLTTATVVEVVGIVIMFVALSRGFALVGVTAAVIALLIGRIADLVLLTNPCLRVLRRQ